MQILPTKEGKEEMLQPLQRLACLPTAQLSASVMQAHFLFKINKNRLPLLL
jgi:hypothetical protein